MVTSVGCVGVVLDRRQRAVELGDERGVELVQPVAQVQHPNPVDLPDLHHVPSLEIRGGYGPVAPASQFAPDRDRQLLRGFELREVAGGVAVVPELFLEDGEEALLQRVRAVLEHVDRPSEVVGRDRLRG